jgi:hypothetical protein
MKNITVCISDNTYRQARIWAARRDTSVSAVITTLFENLPGMARTLCRSPVAKPNETELTAPLSTSN